MPVPVLANCAFGHLHTYEVEPREVSQRQGGVLWFCGFRETGLGGKKGGKMRAFPHMLLPGRASSPFYPTAYVDSWLMIVVCLSLIGGRSPKAKDRCISLFFDDPNEGNQQQQRRE
jgi:hypothetical protein